MFSKALEEMRSRIEGALLACQQSWLRPNPWIKLAVKTADLRARKDSLKFTQPRSQNDP